MSDFRPLRRRNTGTTRKRIKLLDRRLAYLKDRISSYEKQGTDNYADYDREEYASLKWALEIVRQWVDDDPLITYDWSGDQFPATATTDEVVDLLGTYAEYNGERMEIVGSRATRVDGHRGIQLVLRPLDQIDESRPVVRGKVTPVIQVPKPTPNSNGQT